MVVGLVWSGVVVVVVAAAAAAAAVVVVVAVAVVVVVVVLRVTGRRPLVPSAAISGLLNAGV